ncbi:MAG: four helix bundle protein [Patescibacteria group bacterium]|jgi:four helix bundle protein
MVKVIKNFYDLDAWKMGHQLALGVYKTTKGFPKDELYGVVSQLRRAASSITANIAEGFARYHYKDKVKFYHQSRGSTAEVQNFLLLAKDLGYIDLKKCKELGERANEVAKLTNGLIKSIEKQTNY